MGHYLVTGFSTNWVDVEAESEEDAEEIGSRLLVCPSFFDFYVAELIDEDDE